MSHPFFVTCRLRLSKKLACQLIEIDKPLFRGEPHEIFASISCEIVGKNFVRSVISEAHVPGNDEIIFYSVVCGRRNSLQEGFFDKLKRHVTSVFVTCRFLLRAISGPHPAPDQPAAPAQGTRPAPPWT